MLKKKQLAELSKPWPCLQTLSQHNIQ